MCVYETRIPSGDDKVKYGKIFKSYTLHGGGGGGCDVSEV